MPSARSFSRLHKENSKQIADNYLPASLLPICPKTFEKLTFDSIYQFLNKNNLFNNNQSGFRPNDSCIDQLIAITHNIFSAFVANPSLVFSMIYLKHSIDFGMMISFISSRVMELTVIPLTLLNCF